MYTLLLLQEIRHYLTLQVTTGPNSARAISADRAQAEIRPNLVSLVTDPGKKGVIGKLIHSSSCANFIQVKNAVSPNENLRYKTCGKVVHIFG